MAVGIWTTTFVTVTLAAGVLEVALDATLTTGVLEADAEVADLTGVLELPPEGNVSNVLNEEVVLSVVAIDGVADTDEERAEAEEEEEP